MKAKEEKGCLLEKVLGCCEIGATRDMSQPTIQNLNKRKRSAQSRERPVFLSSWFLVKMCAHEKQTSV